VQVSAPAGQLSLPPPLVQLAASAATKARNTNWFRNIIFRPRRKRPTGAGVEQVLRALDLERESARHDQDCVPLRQSSDRDSDHPG